MKKTSAKLAKKPCARCAILARKCTMRREVVDEMSLVGINLVMNGKFNSGAHF